MPNDNMTIVGPLGHIFLCQISTLSFRNVEILTVHPGQADYKYIINYIRLQILDLNKHQNKL